MAKTFESAALAGYPDSAGARILVSTQHGDFAIALVTNDSPVYPVEVFIQKLEGEWSNISESNGPGWRPTEGDRGAITFWDEASENVNEIRIEFLGQTFWCPVRNGYFLFAAWDVPDPGESYASIEPRVSLNPS